MDHGNGPCYSTMARFHDPYMATFYCLAYRKTGHVWIMETGHCTITRPVSMIHTWPVNTFYCLAYRKKWPRMDHGNRPLYYNTASFHDPYMATFYCLAYRKKWPCMDHGNGPLY